MEISIFHETTYLYPEPVLESYTVVYLKPRTDTRQICSKYELETTPPSRIFRYQDRFGNDVQHFTILPEHRALTVTARSQIIAIGEGRAQRPSSASRRQLEADPELAMLYEFMHGSASVIYGEPLRRLLKEIGEPEKAIGDWFVHAGAYIHEHFSYDKNATSVHTDVDEAVLGRAGVCQDFAHVLIGLCRLVGIPARYVSGYLFSGEGRQVLGVEASHAWCEAYLPPHGWVGFDPTNNRLIDDHFVKIAIGRDYRDVSPVRGIYKGPSDSDLRVNVAVESLVPQQ